MHSLYAVKKREIDSQVADQLRRRTDPSNPALHRLKTRRLAENYESRIDGWLAQTSESKIEPLAKQRLACHHTFRERSVDMELANPRVSPMNYIYERTRIDKEVSQGDSSLVMLDRWTQKSGSLFREREPGKEIQPPLVYSHRAEDERINDIIAKNPVMPLQPWTRFDNPIYRKFRGPVEPLKFKGGSDFDLYRARGFGTRSPPQRDFLMSSMEFARPFGSRADDFRPHDPENDLEGQFYNIVPGYSPDSSPGKWRMDPQITGPPESPKMWHTHAPPPRSPNAADIPIESPFHRSIGGGRSQSRTSVSILGDIKGEVPYPQPKTYWKASQQVQNSNPVAAKFYEEEVQGYKPFSDHSERSRSAKKIVLQHQGVKEQRSVSSLTMQRSRDLGLSPVGKGIPGGGGGGGAGGYQHGRPAPLNLPSPRT